MTTRAQQRYSTVAMTFHWVIAVAVIVNWRIVEAAEHAAPAEAGALMANHKALGITILVLSIGRLLWRFTHPAPPLPGAGWERALARTVHVVFYVLLIGLPLGGWLAGSFARRGFEWFGLFDWPLLPVPESREMAGTIIEMHALGGQVLLLLVVLHIAGALKHTFIDRIGGLSRMLPFGKPPG
ncbi:cytochrome b/b6 domain-containing protein [Leptolyngbya sp. 15MV]|nr:cytochrome b/b6 domain-containing protein [Leptolyngbya sp. 15MV]